MSGSIYTRFVSETIDVRGVSVTIRKLAPAHLAEAAKVQTDEAQQEMRRVFDTLGEKLFEDMNRVTPESIEQYRSSVSADPVRAYDRVTLMRHGVTAWSLAGPDGPVPVTPDTLADLDDDAQTAIAGAILALSRPSLYQTEAEAEADRKNG